MRATTFVAALLILGTVSCVSRSENSSSSPEKFLPEEKSIHPVCAEPMTPWVNPGGEKESFFETRQRAHIARVRKFLGLVRDLHDPRFDDTILNREYQRHDQSKFMEPEATPFVHLVWRSKMKMEHQPPYVPDPVMMERMRRAAYHHVACNTHHPEFYDKNATFENLRPLSETERPAPVYAYNAPPTIVATMVCDWMAMSEEFNTDIDQWIENNVNKRWMFREEQVALIKELVAHLRQHLPEGHVSHHS
jgi:hypothetical protein